MVPGVARGRREVSAGDLRARGNAESQWSETGSNRRTLEMPFKRSRKTRTRAGMPSRGPGWAIEARTGVGWVLGRGGRSDVPRGVLWRAGYGVGVRTLSADGMKETCGRCDGCGRIADTDGGEPWIDWLSLPGSGGVAVLEGHVRPVQCPNCEGSGWMPAGSPTPLVRRLRQR